MWRLSSDTRPAADRYCRWMDGLAQSQQLQQQGRGKREGIGSGPGPGTRLGVNSG